MWKAEAQKKEKTEQVTERERSYEIFDEDPYPNPHLKKRKPRKRSGELREEKVGLGFLMGCVPKFEAF